MRAPRRSESKVSAGLQGIDANGLRIKIIKEDFQLHMQFLITLHHLKTKTPYLKPADKSAINEVIDEEISSITNKQLKLLASTCLPKADAEKLSRQLKTLESDTAEKLSTEHLLLSDQEITDYCKQIYGTGEKQLTAEKIRSVLGMIVPIQTRYAVLTKLIDLLLSSTTVEAGTVLIPLDTDTDNLNFLEESHIKDGDITNEPAADAKTINNITKAIADVAAKTKQAASTEKESYTAKTSADITKAITTNKTAGVKKAVIVRHGTNITNVATKTRAALQVRIRSDINKALTNMGIRAKAATTATKNQNAKTPLSLYRKSLSSANIAPNKNPPHKISK